MGGVSKLEGAAYSSLICSTAICMRARDTDEKSDVWRFSGIIITRTIRAD